MTATKSEIEPRGESITADGDPIIHDVLRKFTAARTHVYVYIRVGSGSVCAYGMLRHEQSKFTPYSIMCQDLSYAFFHPRNVSEIVISDTGVPTITLGG